MKTEIINLPNGKIKILFWFGEKPKRLRIKKEKFIIWKGEKIKLKNRINKVKIIYVRKYKTKSRPRKKR